MRSEHQADDPNYQRQMNEAYTRREKEKKPIENKKRKDLTNQ